MPVLTVTKGLEWDCRKQIITVDSSNTPAVLLLVTDSAQHNYCSGTGSVMQLLRWITGPWGWMVHRWGKWELGKKIWFAQEHNMTWRQNQVYNSGPLLIRCLHFSLGSGTRDGCWKTLTVLKPEWFHSCMHLFIHLMSLPNTCYKLAMVLVFLNTFL